MVNLRPGKNFDFVLLAIPPGLSVAFLDLGQLHGSEKRAAALVVRVELEGQVAPAVGHLGALTRHRDRRSMRSSGARAKVRRARMCVRCAAISVCSFNYRPVAMYLADRELCLSLKEPITEAIYHFLLCSVCAYANYCWLRLVLIETLYNSGALG